MKKHLSRIGVATLVVLAIAMLAGCSKEETGDAKAEAAKIDKGLEGMPPVPKELAGTGASEQGAADQGAPLGKKGAGGGGP